MDKYTVEENIVYKNGDQYFIVDRLEDDIKTDDEAAEYLAQCLNQRERGRE